MYNICEENSIFSIKKVIDYEKMKKNEKKFALYILFVSRSLHFVISWILKQTLITQTLILCFCCLINLSVSQTLVPGYLIYSPHLPYSGLFLTEYS